MRARIVIFLSENIMKVYSRMLNVFLCVFGNYRRNVTKIVVFWCSAMSGKEADFTVYVRRDGRMTVPKEVRDALGIREGDLVKCKIRKVETL